jgi:hypothetical protein
MLQIDGGGRSGKNSSGFGGQKSSSEKGRHEAKNPAASKETHEAAKKILRYFFQFLKNISREYYFETRLKSRPWKRSWKDHFKSDRLKNDLRSDQDHIFWKNDLGLRSFFLNYLNYLKAVSNLFFRTSLKKNHILVSVLTTLGEDLLGE